MNKERLTEILLDQKETFAAKTGLIERDIPLEDALKTSLVVVITGVRRCGKSSLLFLIKEKMELDDAGYCYFNFDDERIVDDVSLLENIDNLHKEIYGTEPLLFLDEIQNITGWEKFVNRMYEQGRKVFVTGSNASILSSEIATSLTGRNKVIELMPFSFREYLRFKNISLDVKRLSSKKRVQITGAFDKFMVEGGFPLVVQENDAEILTAYFKDIFYRDIIARYRLGQVDEIKQIGIYFLSNVAKKFSYSTLQKISSVKSLSSIKNYLTYYSGSFLFYYLNKFDFSIKKQILNPKKVFAIDQGFIHKIGFNFSANKGRVLENIVFLELKRRKKEVYYFEGKGECDFVVKQGTHIVQAVQVTYLLNNDNLKRETDGLLEAMTTHHLTNALLLYYDKDLEENRIPEGITSLPVWKWLLSE
jgi:predicted AAA+ superfamily ATPase